MARNRRKQQKEERGREKRWQKRRGLERRVGRWETTEVVLTGFGLFNPDRRVWWSEEGAKEVADMVLDVMSEHLSDFEDNSVKIWTKKKKRKKNEHVRGSFGIEFGTLLAKADVIVALEELGWEFVTLAIGGAAAVTSCIFRRLRHPSPSSVLESSESTSSSY